MTTNPGGLGGSVAGCSACGLWADCLASTVSKGTLGDFEGLIVRSAPIHSGGTVFRQGDPFRYLAVVRAGSVKTISVDANGLERTLGFHLSGDFVGMGAIDEARHRCTAVAIDTVVVCRFPFDALMKLCEYEPKLQFKLFQILSHDIARATDLSSTTTADQRLAAFLLNMAERMAVRGYSANRWQLTMSRTDIASFLRLAPETLSRLLRRFQGEKLASFEGREVEVLGPERLKAIAKTGSTGTER